MEEIGCNEEVRPTSCNFLGLEHIQVLAQGERDLVVKARSISAAILY